jgi:Phage ABA sandwich domain
MEQAVKPGPELDALVYEKVFGNRPFKRDPLVPRFLPHYSTSIADAWKVMEKLGDGCVNEFRTHRSCVGRCGWHAHFGNLDLPNVDAWSDTAPHAICLAALRAVGIEIEEETPE